MEQLPRVVFDEPMSPMVLDMIRGQVTVVPWSQALRDGGTFDAIYTYGHPRVDGELLDRLPGVKVISNFGVGVDHINVRDATARGIKVGNTPGVLNGATADLAFALILATARGIVKNDQYARSPEFTVYDPGFFLGQEVHGSVIGIIGMGGIGEQIAKRAYAFDMKILYHNRNRNLSAEAKYDASYASLAELLRRCDFVVLSCPLTSETRGLIGVAQLAQMKPSAILVNVARGGVVNTDALTAALASRQILRAGLDVTDPEPLPRDHPLLQSEHVTILPHLGSATVQTRTRMAELSVRNLMCGLRGQPLLHSVL